MICRTVHANVTPREAARQGAVPPPRSGNRPTASRGEITRALAALGRNGVPVYVLYRPGKAPLLLPEILQKDTVLDALATL